MRQMERKVLAALMAGSMTLSMVPAQAMAAGTQLTGFSDMPGDYSAQALQHAVEHGLLGGYEGRILPDDPLTRAQMACILARALGSEGMVSLDGFRDVEPEAWYVRDLSAAVAMGLFAGDGDTMRPNDSITREEICTVLARALGLTAADTSALDAFRDGDQVSSWARPAVAAMVEAGYLSGSDGSLLPGNRITRKDFAVIMHAVAPNYISQAGTYTTLPQGSVVVNVPGAVLKDVTIQGDLILSDGIGPNDVTLDHVTVQGRVVVRGGQRLAVQGGTVDQIVLVKPAGEVTVAAEQSARVERVTVRESRETVRLEGSVSRLEIADRAQVRLDGAQVDQVDLDAPQAEITVGSGSKVGQMTTAPQARDSVILVEQDAAVQQITSQAPDVQIGGQGTVEQATVSGDRTRVDTKDTQITVIEGTADVTANGKPADQPVVPVAPVPGEGGGGGVPTPVPEAWEQVHSRTELEAALARVTPDRKLKLKLAEDYHDWDLTGLTYYGRELQLDFGTGRTVTGFGLYAPSAENILLKDGGTGNKGSRMGSLTINAPGAEVSNELEVTGTTDIVAVREGTFCVKDKSGTIRMRSGALKLAQGGGVAAPDIQIPAGAKKVILDAPGSQISSQSTGALEIRNAGELQVLAANPNIKITGRIVDIAVEAGAAGTKISGLGTVTGTVTVRAEANIGLPEVSRIEVTADDVVLDVMAGASVKQVVLRGARPVLNGGGTIETAAAAANCGEIGGNASIGTMEVQFTVTLNTNHTEQVVIPVVEDTTNPDPIHLTVGTGTALPTLVVQDPDSTVTLSSGSRIDHARVDAAGATLTTTDPDAGVKRLELRENGTVDVAVTEELSVSGNADTVTTGAKPIRQVRTDRSVALTGEAAVEEVHVSEGTGSVEVKTTGDVKVEEVSSSSSRDVTLTDVKKGDGTPITPEQIIHKAELPVGVRAEQPRTAGPDQRGKLLGLTTAMEFGLQTEQGVRYEIATSASAAVAPGAYAVRTRGGDGVQPSDPVLLTVDRVYGIRVPAAVAEKGSVVLENTVALAGETVVLTVQPRDYFRVVSVAASGTARVDDLGDNRYTFTMPEADTELSVTFGNQKAKSPMGLSAADAMTTGEAQTGKIFGLKPGMEYAPEGSEAYTPVSGSALNSADHSLALAPGRYQVRTMGQPDGGLDPSDSVVLEIRGLYQMNFLPALKDRGILTYSGDPFRQGDEITFAIAPSDGTTLDGAVRCTNADSLRELGGGRYGFTAPASDVDLVVAFRQEKPANVTGEMASTGAPDQMGTLAGVSEKMEYYQTENTWNAGTFQPILTEQMSGNRLALTPAMYALRYQGDESIGLKPSDQIFVTIPRAHGIQISAALQAHLDLEQSQIPTVGQEHRDALVTLVPKSDVTMRTPRTQETGYALDTVGENQYRFEVWDDDVTLDADFTALLPDQLRAEDSQQTGEHQTGKLLGVTDQMEYYCSSVHGSTANDFKPIEAKDIDPADQSITVPTGAYHVRVRDDGATNLTHSESRRLEIRNLYGMSYLPGLKEKGILTASQDTYRGGETITLTVTPLEGTTLKNGVKVDGMDQVEQTPGTYQFTAPYRDVTVTMAFQQDIGVITAENSAVGGPDQTGKLIGVSERMEYYDLSDREWGMYRPLPTDQMTGNTLQMKPGEYSLRMAADESIELSASTYRIVQIDWMYRILTTPALAAHMDLEQCQIPQVSKGWQSQQVTLVPKSDVELKGILVGEKQVTPNPSGQYSISVTENDVTLDALFKAAAPAGLSVVKAPYDAPDQMTRILGVRADMEYCTATEPDGGEGVYQPIPAESIDPRDSGISVPAGIYYVRMQGDADTNLEASDAVRLDTRSSFVLKYLPGLKEKGLLTMSQERYRGGETIELTVQAPHDQVTVNSVSCTHVEQLNDLGGGRYSFIAPADDVTIQVNLEQGSTDGLSEELADGDQAPAMGTLVGITEHMEYYRVQDGSDSGTFLQITPEEAADSRMELTPGRYRLRMAGDDSIGLAPGSEYQFEIQVGYYFRYSENLSRYLDAERSSVPALVLPESQLLILVPKPGYVLENVRISGGQNLTKDLENEYSLPMPASSVTLEAEGKPNPPTELRADPAPMEQLNPMGKLAGVTTDLEYAVAGSEAPGQEVTYQPIRPEDVDPQDNSISLPVGTYLVRVKADPATGRLASEPATYTIYEA